MVLTSMSNHCRMRQIRWRAYWCLPEAKNQLQVFMQGPYQNFKKHKQ